MKRKLAILAAILLLAAGGADLYLGTRIADGKFQGIQVPPYGVLTEKTVEILARRLAQLRTGRPMPTLPLRNFSPRYGWGNLPGACNEGGFRLAINSVGARGAREVEPAPPAGRLRVLCFGESFTYGTEVADGEDWPAQLEALEPRLEVLNFGVGAWGTDQALLRFRDVAPTLEPDVVILGLLLENICRNVNRFRQMYQPGDALALGKPRFRLVGGELELVPLPYASEIEFLEDAVAGKLRETLGAHEWWAGDDPPIPFSNLARAWATHRAFERRRPWRLWSRPKEEPYQVTLALLEAFQREALSLGARAAPVVLYQSQGDHAQVELAGGERYWSGLEADLERAGVPLVDTFETVAGRIARGESAYRKVHHDPATNRAIAALVLDWLRERLPELR